MSEVVKIISVVDLGRIREYYPHNIFKKYFGYSYINIIRCPTVDPCVKSHYHEINTSIFRDHIWVDNKQDLPPVHIGSTLIIHIEPTKLGYHIVDWNHDSNPCRYCAK